MTRVVDPVAKGDLRHGWRSPLGLALIVGLVGAVVLATASGARRTASVVDRAQEATGTHDLRVQVDAFDPAVLGDVGVVTDPAQPWVVLGALLPLALALALLVAAVPAWRASRRRPGQVLRTE